MAPTVYVVCVRACMYVRMCARVCACVGLYACVGIFSILMACTSSSGFVFILKVRTTQFRLVKIECNRWRGGCYYKWLAVQLGTFYVTFKSLKIIVCLLHLCVYVNLYVAPTGSQSFVLIF